MYWSEITRIIQSKARFSVRFAVRSYVYSKDVRLPVQLQRAMAAEAEAAREARAKVNKATCLFATCTSS
jgi:hypothetical protein